MTMEAPNMNGQEDVPVNELPHQSGPVPVQENTELDPSVPRNPADNINAPEAQGPVDSRGVDFIPTPEDLKDQEASEQVSEQANGQFEEPLNK